jgi:hypothetical protein
MAGSEICFIVHYNPEPAIPFYLFNNITLTTMQAIRLQKKYPEVSQNEMFDLISRFKCVRSSPWVQCHNDIRVTSVLFTQTFPGA